MASITKHKKQDKFYRSFIASWGFYKIKKNMTIAQILWLPKFSKAFEVSCNASKTRIRGVVSQDGHPITFFSEKLNNIERKYSTYDKKLCYCAIIGALAILLAFSRICVVCSNHQALKFIHSQKNLNSRHAKQVKFIK